MCLMPENVRFFYFVYLHFVVIYILAQKFILSPKVQNHYDELKSEFCFKVKEMVIIIIS